MPIKNLHRLWEFEPQITCLTIESYQSICVRVYLIPDENSFQSWVFTIITGSSLSVFSPDGLGVTLRKQMPCI